jgi:hypothetical protein
MVNAAAVMSFDFVFGGGRFKNGFYPFALFQSI